MTSCLEGSKAPLLTSCIQFYLDHVRGLVGFITQCVWQQLVTACSATADMISLQCQEWMQQRVIRLLLQRAVRWHYSVVCDIPVSALTGRLTRTHQCVCSLQTTAQVLFELHNAGTLPTNCVSGLS